jgi:carbamoyltransferase
LDYLIREAGIRLSDIDTVVYPSIDGTLPDKDRMLRLLERALEVTAGQPALGKKCYERITSEIALNESSFLTFRQEMEGYGLSNRIIMADHHHCHAAGAFHCSGFSDGLVFTCDGKGGFRTTAVWSAQGAEIKLKDYTTTFDSPGYFYANITKALGFRHERHEGKVTGLAAMGDPKPFRHVTDGILQLIDGRVHATLGPHYLPWFAEQTDLPELYELAANYRREDVAAAAQATLEAVLCGWISESIRRYSPTGRTKIALAGGVFGNVKLNQRIRELPCVDNIFVFPAMSDGGLPLGAVLALLAQKAGTQLSQPINGMSLGPKYSRSDVRNLLDAKGLKWKEAGSSPEALAQSLAHLFSQGRPVGLFRGRMEFGPRALCNRSIVYHAKDPSINVWLNKRLNRSEFMPFAPVTIAELAPKCFKGWRLEDRCADFMTMTYDVTQEFLVDCPAAVHVDKTARPQVVRRESDPELHAILAEYFRLTGELAILNTSFNNHEEPIVCSPTDALASYGIGNIDALLIEGALVDGSGH